MKAAVLIPAAGASKRFAGGDSPNKLEIDLAGRPVFLRSIELFLNRPRVGRIILAVQPDAVEDFKLRYGDMLSFHGVRIVPGGKAERWETVLKALDALDAETREQGSDPGYTHIAVHDAARPLASDKLIDRVFDAAETYAAVIPAVPVSATLKRVAALRDDDASAGADPLDAILGTAGKPISHIKRALETVDRRDLVEVQTPQVFELELFRKAYALIREGKLAGEGVTDDAALVEALGETVYVVEGESTNLKITRPADAELAQALAEKREKATKKNLAKKRLFADDDDL